MELPALTSCRVLVWEPRSLEIKSRPAVSDIGSFLLRLVAS